MSDDLMDEVEAINSIYGDGSLTHVQDDSSSASSLSYILKLPGDASSSLRIRFPQSYPASSSPPVVVGTHHSSGGVKGAGVQDGQMFGSILKHVFRPGAVCLFDALDEFVSRRRSGGGDEDGPSTDEQDFQDAVVAADKSCQSPSAADEADVPDWILSEAIVESKSVFVARVSRVTSLDQARRHIAHLLATNNKVRGATHNITAWRIRGPGSLQFQDCDDDGETAAGGRVLRLMQLMGVWDVVVVVSRWFGGVKLGPRRFALINAVARDGLVRAGLAG